MREFYCQS